MTEISINDSNMLITENKKDDNFYFYKVVYLIITTIICFLGILIIIENFSLFFFSSKITFKNFVVFYIIYNSCSWLIIYLLALIVYKFANKYFAKNLYNEEASEEDLELKQITNQNTLFNKSSNLKEKMLNNNNLGKLNTENKDLDIINLDKNKELPNNHLGKKASSVILKSHLYKSNVTLNNLNANLHLEDYENKNINLNNANNKKYLLNPFLKSSNYILNYLYLSLMLINYSIISIIGIIIASKLYKEEVFKNYKLHYKIYLFVLLSLTKSAIIVIGFIYKFVSRKIESNSKKFDLNEEFLKEIEKEIQEANKISGIISPDKNLIKYNDMFNRQDFNKISSFNLNDSHNRNSKLEKNSADNLIIKDETFLNNELNIELRETKKETEKVNSYNNNEQMPYLEGNLDKKERTYFNFRIGEKPVNAKDTEHYKSNFKMKSEKKFKLGIESVIPEKLNGNHANENKKNFKKSFSNINNFKKNIIIDDFDLLNNKIDLEKLEPKLQEIRDSKFKQHEERKNELKQQIRDSYLADRNPNKNKILEYKKKLENLKNSQNYTTQSPKAKKSTNENKVFFDEALQIYDIKEKFNITEESLKHNNSNLAELKFSTTKDIKKIKNLEDFMHNAKRISKDDFDISKLATNNSGNFSRR